MKSSGEVTAVKKPDATKPKKDAKSLSRARGDFVPPGYEYRYEALTDLIRFGPELFSPSQFLVLLFLAERTVVYAKPSDTASLAQMRDGVYNRLTKERYRGSVGVGKSACISSLNALEQMGVISKTLHRRNDGGQGTTEYKINWETLRRLYVKVMPDNGRVPKRQGRPKNSQAGSPKQQGPVHAEDGPSVPKSDRVCAVAGQQQIRSNRRDSKQKKKESEEEPASQETNKTVSRGSSRGEKKSTPKLKDNFLSIDDDETLTAPRATDRGPRQPLEDPEEEFMARIAERHGRGSPRFLDPKYAVSTIKKHLEELGIDFNDFLHLDSQATTQPHLLDNPMGHYVQLTRKEKKRRQGENAKRAAELRNSRLITAREEERRAMGQRTFAPAAAIESVKREMNGGEKAPQNVVRQNVPCVHCKGNRRFLHSDVWVPCICASAREIGIYRFRSDSIRREWLESIRTGTSFLDNGASPAAARCTRCGWPIGHGVLLNESGDGFVPCDCATAEFSAELCKADTDAKQFQELLRKEAERANEKKQREDEGPSRD